MATASNDDSELRQQLVSLLKGGQAHLDFSSAVKDFPIAEAASKPGNAPHSAWQLLEHLRITQHDILEFSSATEYHRLKWPDDYWPKSDAPPNAQVWANSVKAFEADLEAMKKLATDPAHDLYKPLPNGDGQTLLREILLVADHNSHHLGQFLFLKKMLGVKAAS